MSNDNTEIEDTEGHKLSSKRIEEAGAEAEGHKLSSKRIGEAGDDDDAEGHRISSKR